MHSFYVDTCWALYKDQRLFQYHITGLVTALRQYNNGLRQIMHSPSVSYSYITPPSVYCLLTLNPIILVYKYYIREHHRTCMQMLLLVLKLRYLRPAMLKYLVGGASLWCQAADQWRTYLTVWTPQESELKPICNY